MASIRPMRIPGRWREGFVLDYHTVGSIYLGDDEYGHPIFDTTRTELGELLYRLKYRSDTSVLNELVDTIAGFVDSWKPGAALIIPVPPSRTGRPQQPVLLLADALSKRLGVRLATDAVTLMKNFPELKNVYDYMINGSAFWPTRIRSSPLWFEDSECCSSMISNDPALR